jgi:hypothetical protein
MIGYTNTGALQNGALNDNVRRLSAISKNNTAPLFGDYPIKESPSREATEASFFTVLQNVNCAIPTWANAGLNFLRIPSLQQDCGRTMVNIHKLGKNFLQFSKISVTVHSINAVGHFWRGMPGAGRSG